jgi:nitrous oxidase accessory protein NosD
MSAKLAKIAVTAALAATPLVVWLPSASAQGAVACGSMVTGPVRLSGDLSCNGDGVTLLGGQLDLHHHTITGNGTGTGITVAGATGGARVVDGTVTGFANGIAAKANVFVYHSTIDRNTSGIAVVADARAYVSKSTIDSNATGVDCSEGVVIVSGSLVSSNAIGVRLFDCEGSVVSGSVVRGNTQAGVEELEGFTDVANPTLTVRRDLFESNAVAIHLTALAQGVVVRASRFVGNGSNVVTDS